MDLRHHVLPINRDGGAFGRAQGHVQHGAIFGNVDFFALEHGVNARAQIGFVGHLDQEFKRFVGDAIL